MMRPNNLPGRSPTRKLARNGVRGDVSLIVFTIRGYFPDRDRDNF